MDELKQLSDELQNDALTDKQAQFVRKYGKYFGNNAGLGVALFNEAERAGINTDAAMIEAIQDMMNQIRKENDTLTEALAIVTNAAQKSSDKIDKIDEAVSKAVLNQPEAISSTSPDTVLQQAADTASGADMPLQSALPQGVDPNDPALYQEVDPSILGIPMEGAEETSAAEMPSEPAPAPEEPSVPAEPPAPVPEEPTDVVSDGKLKRLHSLRDCISDYRSKRILGRI
jgi:hypothetical protein